MNEGVKIFGVAFLYCFVFFDELKKSGNKRFNPRIVLDFDFIFNI